MNVVLPRSSGSPVTTRKAPVPTPCKHSNWRHAQAAGSNGSHNVALFNRRAPDAFPVQLCGTPTPSEALYPPRAVPTYIGPNVSGLIHSRRDESPTKELGENAKYSE
jgi:hypothetical protein